MKRDMTGRFIRIQNEEMWISGEPNTLVQYMFHSYSKPEGALEQKLLTYGQTHTAIAVAEDNKHTIVKIYGLCVFFKLSSSNK